MALIVGVNSYLDIDEADELLNNNIYSDSVYLNSWNKLSDRDRQVLLIQSTSILEGCVYLGSIKNSGQSLKFPRYINGVDVGTPDDIKLACILQGLKDIDIKNREEYKITENGIKSYTIKGASITLRDAGNFGRTNNNIYNDIYSNYINKYAY